MVASSVLALLAAGGIGSWTTRIEQRTVETVLDESMPSLAMLGEIEATFLALEVEASGHIATKEPTLKDSAQKAVDEGFKKLEADFSAYAKIVSDEEGKKMLAQEQKLLQDYIPVAHQMMESSRGYDVDAATSLLFGKLRPISQSVTAPTPKDEGFPLQGPRPVR